MLYSLKSNPKFLPSIQKVRWTKKLFSTQQLVRRTICKTEVWIWTPKVRCLRCFSRWEKHWSASPGSERRLRAWFRHIRCLVAFEIPYSSCLDLTCQLRRTQCSCKYSAVSSSLVQPSHIPCGTSTDVRHLKLDKLMESSRSQRLQLVKCRFA